MNIFTSIKIIFKALSENYKSGKELSERVSQQQAQTLLEARRKVMLKTQIKERLEVASNYGNAALIIQIAEECLPYVDDIAEELKYDCIITPTAKEDEFLLQICEEEF